MNLLSDGIELRARQAEAVWGRAYPLFDRLILDRGLRTGVELGVAFGGHAEAILSTTAVDLLYGVDPFERRPDYHDPMNLPQQELDELHTFTLKRLGRFGERYRHLRAHSATAVLDIVGELDFVYIDADHSYAAVWRDLCAWFPKVREGGIIGGHDYLHPDFPGIAQAVDRFFRRLGWEVHAQGEGVWWVEKRPLRLSFIVPAYNCEQTLADAVTSIMRGGFGPGDEVVIANDGSTDGSQAILDSLQAAYLSVRVVRHRNNRGGGAARNTAVEATSNPLIFCLDSDNLLEDHSIQPLKEFLTSSGADVASFRELRYFQRDWRETTHKWVFRAGLTTLADYLSGHVVPGASGNYMFTRESWIKAGGYPEFAGALDAWGFGLRQVATGSKMMVMPESHYYHRYGHESYWVRESTAKTMSRIALQVLLPYLDMIAERDADYIMSRRGRETWFATLNRRPIRLKTGEPGACGVSTSPTSEPVQAKSSLLPRLLARGLGALGDLTRRAQPDQSADPASKHCDDPSL